MELFCQGKLVYFKTGFRLIIQKNTSAQYWLNRVYFNRINAAGGKTSIYLRHVYWYIVSIFSHFNKRKKDLNCHTIRQYPLIFQQAIEYNIF